MRSNHTARPPQSRIRPQRTTLIGSGLAIIAIGSAALLFATPNALAIGTGIDLGTATSYSALGGQTVTNTGNSVLSNSLGVSPGTSVTGFPPGIILPPGTIHQTDANAGQAQSDLTTAHNAAAGQAADAQLASDLAGLTLTAGVYHREGALQLTGALTLDAQGDPDAVFIFQIDSGLVTAPGSSVLITNGGQSCNVYWKVGESAVIDTSTTFVGTIMALTSISLDTGATVEGRALARNGSVTLNNNTFTQGICTTSTPSTTPSASSSATPPIVASSSGASTPPPTEGRVSSPRSRRLHQAVASPTPPVVEAITGP